MEDYRTDHPSTAALVVEIAISSIGLDHGKIALYAEAGVGEYWIIVPAQRAVEIHRQPEGGTYRSREIVKDDATLECAAVPSLRVKLSDLFGSR